MNNNPSPAALALRSLAPRPLGLYFGLLWQWEVFHSLAAPWVAGEDLPASPTARELEGFLVGVQRYRAHPFFAERSGPWKLWGQEGRVRLYACGGRGPAVLLVPSVINKPYIFDLMPGASLVDFLRNRGHRVFVVDWGGPEEEAGLDFNALLVEKFFPLLARLVKETGVPVPLVGYCLGGILALAAAVARPKEVSAVACAATPWDFSETDFHKTVTAGRTWYELMLASGASVPVDMLQTQFMLLEPLGAIRRMQAFGSGQTTEQLNRMAAIEDWLADGVELDAPLAHTILLEWYAQNATAGGGWRVGGKMISPEKLKKPLFVAVPQRDVIVPPAAARALAVAGATEITVPSGHIGLMVGRRASECFYRPLAEWLEKLP